MGASGHPMSVSLYGHVSCPVGCLLLFRWQTFGFWVRNYLMWRQEIPLAHCDTHHSYLVVGLLSSILCRAHCDCKPSFPSTLNTNSCLGRLVTARLPGAATTVGHTSSRVTQPKSCSSSRGSGANVDGVQVPCFPSLLFPFGRSTEGLCNSRSCSSPPH